MSKGSSSKMTEEGNLYWGVSPPMRSLGKNSASEAGSGGAWFPCNIPNENFAKSLGERYLHSMNSSKLSHDFWKAE